MIELVARAGGPVPSNERVLFDVRTHQYAVVITSDDELLSDYQARVELSGKEKLSSARIDELKCHLIPTIMLCRIQVTGDSITRDDLFSVLTADLYFHLNTGKTKRIGTVSGSCLIAYGCQGELRNHS